MLLKVIKDSWVALLFWKCKLDNESAFQNGLDTPLRCPKLDYPKLEVKHGLKNKS